MRVHFPAILLFVATLAKAQSTQGGIGGVVTDADGNAVAGARIICQNAEASARVEADTDGAGRFLLSSVPPGTYRLSVEAAGFQRQEVQELMLPVAGFLEVPFQLRKSNDVWEARLFRNLILPGRATLLRFYGPDLDLSRTVTLDGIKYTSGTMESTLSAAMSPAQVESLPFVGRDVYTALALQANTASDTTTSRGIGVSVNGQRPYSANFLLDGVENNNFLITGPLTGVAPEGIQEFRISTNNFSAEYGWSGGYIANAVTRGGNDLWHATAYLNVKNEVLNANDFSRNTAGLERNPLKELQSGVQAGGPLRKEKLYNGAFVEQLHNGSRDLPLTFSLPSPFLFAQLPSLPQGSQARKLLTLFPVPNIPSKPNPDDPNLVLVTQAPALTLNRIVATDRLDHLLGRHRIMGRIAVFRLDRPDFTWSPYPEFSGGLDQNATSAAASVDSQFTPSLSNAARGAVFWDRIEFDRPHPEIPTLSVSSFGAPTLLPGSLAAYGYRNRNHGVELNDGLHWSLGRHLTKFGAGFLTRKVDGFLTFAQAGQYVFGPIPSFLADFPDVVRLAVDRQQYDRGVATSPPYDREYRIFQMHAYAQDSFRVSPRLTVNGGFRLEVSAAPRNIGPVKDAVVALGPGDNLAEAVAGAHMMYPSAGDRPLYTARTAAYDGRLGISFRAAQSTVLRAAVGTFHDRPFDNLWQNLRNNSIELGSFHPGRAVAYLDAPNSLLASFSHERPDDRSSRLTAFQPSIRAPRVVSYFAGVEQRLGILTVSANASGAYGRGLLTTDIVNRSYSRPGIQDAFASRLQPNLQEIYYRGNQGSSNYNAASLELRYRNRQLSGQLAYTWSHSIDNQSEPLAGDYFDLSFTRAVNVSRKPQSTFTRQFDSSGDRGNSDFDQRHNLVFYTLWEPRIAARPRWLVNGWHLGLLGAVRSGLPYSVTAPSASFSPLIGNRADLLGAPEQGQINLPADGGKILLRSSAFSGGRAVVGNTGRNAFRGPSFFNLDFSLARTVTLPKFGETARLTLRADAYNVLNHANLGNPDAFLGSPTFGLATYGRQEASTGFPALAPFKETARQVQLMVRLQF